MSLGFNCTRYQVPSIKHLSIVPNFPLPPPLSSYLIVSILHQLCHHVVDHPPCWKLQPSLNLGPNCSQVPGKRGVQQFDHTPIQLFKQLQFFLYWLHLNQPQREVTILLEKAWRSCQVLGKCSIKMGLRWRWGRWWKTGPHTSWQWVLINPLRKGLEKLLRTWKDV